MFKVGKFEVRFSKLWHGNPVTLTRSSRFDTSCCITAEGVDFIGIAQLHPNDQPNKITGKKVALAKALSQGLLKPERTLIWDAFWEWVQGWGIKDTANEDS